MSSDTERDVSIRRSAARLRAGTIAGMAVLGLAVAAAWLGAAFGGVRVEVQDHSGLIDPRLGGTIAMLLVEIALFRLTQMLAAIRDGDLFSIRVVRHFRGFAFWLLVVAVLGVLGPLVAPMLGGTPPIDGRHRVALVFDLTQLLAVGITVFLFLLARLLERARELEAEMQEIV